jgi:small subunit ribosomal protein S4
MARYTGPKTKISRKFGEPLFGEDRTLEKKKLSSWSTWE